MGDCNGDPDLPLAFRQPELRHICGFLEVDSGEIVLDDQVLSNGKMGNKRVGFIIENPAFLPQYSGFQNLVMLYSINNKTDTKVIKKYMSMMG